MDKKLFNELEANLNEGLKYVRGEKAKASVYVVLSPADIKAIRHKVQLSQKEFAEQFNVPIDTLKGWEQGKRSLDAAQSNYLRLIEADPDFVKASLAA